MKFFLVAAVVLFVLWLVRSGERVRGPGGSRHGARREQAPVEMTQCAHCGVHLPRNEALSGPGGAYCSEAHRQAGPRRA